MKQVKVLETTTICVEKGSIVYLDDRQFELVKNKVEEVKPTKKKGK